MSLEACPNEVLTKILIRVPLDDLPACMEASARLRSLIKTTFLDRSSRLSKVLEINYLFYKVLTKTKREGSSVFVKASKLLRFSELDVNRCIRGIPLLSIAIRKRKYGIASLMLQKRTDLDVNATEGWGLYAPVHLAAGRGKVKLVSQIVGHQTYIAGKTTVNYFQH